LTEVQAECEVAELSAEVAELRGMLAARDALIRWLALPLGTNNPIFPEADVFGEPMPEAQLMRATYAEVVGRPVCEIGDCETTAEPGYRRCEAHW
jgi:hypothetical protein